MATNGSGAQQTPDGKHRTDPNRSYSIAVPWRNLSETFCTVETEGPMKREFIHAQPSRTIRSEPGVWHHTGRSKVVVGFAAMVKVGECEPPLLENARGSATRVAVPMHVHCNMYGEA